MLKPDYDSTLTGRKVEELLMDRLTDMFYSMQSRRGDLFDESEEWVEYLLSWETDSCVELVDFRKKLSKAYVLRLSEYYLAARPIENALAKRRYLKLNKAILDWQYRKDLLAKVVEIYFKRQVLQYRKTTYATLTGVDTRNEDMGKENARQVTIGSNGDGDSKEHPHT